MENKSKQELLDEMGKLAEAHNEMEQHVKSVLDRMDIVEIQYEKIRRYLKNKRNGQNG